MTNTAQNFQCSNAFSMRWFIGLLLLFSLGCNTDNDQSLTTVSLSPETQRLLEQMNSLAAEPLRQRSFRYGLRANCTLAVQALLLGRPTERYMVAIGPTRFERFAYAPGLGYALRAPVGKAGGIVPIFEAKTMEQITQMEALLHSLAVFCKA
jgi:hypothetical protein